VNKKIRSYRIDPYLDSQIRKMAQESNTSNSSIVNCALNSYFNKPKK